MSKELEELKRRVAELEAKEGARKEAAEGKVTPLGTEMGGHSRKLADQLLSIPRDALEEMCKATPPSVMADLRSDVMRNWWPGNLPKKEPKKG